jgi:protein-tyrosine phosphatase
MALEHILGKYRSTSRGHNLDRHAVVFPRILLGPACYLNPVFVNLHNITHIINCAENSVCPTWAKRWVGENYTCITAIDHPEYEILRNCLDTFSATMDRFLRDPTCQNIYVHCYAGMNRSACLILAYIHRRFRVSLETLLDTTARQRPCILTNKGFQKQLLECK